MRGGESGQRRKWLARAAFWLGAGLLVAAALRSIQLTDGDPPHSAGRSADDATLRTIRVKQVDPPPAGTDADLRAPTIEPADLELIAGETASIAARDLPTDRALILDLRLSREPPMSTALSARIAALDRGAAPDARGETAHRWLAAAVAEQGDRARVEIERGWLSPGRYRIEIEAAARPSVRLEPYWLDVD